MGIYASRSKTFPRSQSNVFSISYRVSQILVDHLPKLRELCQEMIEVVFVPKAIFKQLVLLIALETGLVTLSQLTHLIHYCYSRFSSRQRLIRKLLNEQTQVSTQDEWMELAEQIDQIQGNDIWRQDPDCPLYEQSRISARIDEFVHLMRRGDIFELMFVLRGSLSRNKFGLLHEGLFSKAMAGSKVLVETYHNVVCAALDFVCDAVPINAGTEDLPIPTDARLAFFNETRHAYGRTALLLSGGAALGFYHVGVAKTLMENGLMPRVLGGSSAGSILCAMIGTRTDQECLDDLFQAKGTTAPGHSGKLPLNFFRPINQTEETEQFSHKKYSGPGGIGEVYHNTAGAFRNMKRTVQGFIPIPLRVFSSFVYDVIVGNRRAQDVFKNDNEHFRKCVRADVGDFTFQEAFDRTGRILNIVVTPNNASDPPRLLNYLTTPHVMVWSAAVASASLPGVFEANRLVVKEADGWERYESRGDDQRFSDGSMESDLPMQQLSEMFNVNHFIISQANPHAVMFASYYQKTGVWSNPIQGALTAVVTFLRDQVRSWIKHLVECIGARRIAPLFDTQRGMGTQFFTQEYEGRSCDISLIPWLNHRSLFSAMLHIVYNPSEAEFREWVQAAERETWRYIPAIKSHIKEEVTLDLCVQRLRKRLVQESWEKRVATTGKLGDRVPSFFNSPSLVNLGGLAISDQPNIEGLRKNLKSPTSSATRSLKDTDGAVPLPSLDINSGWGGLGLRGNRSSGNLQRTSSDASGLFIDDEEGAQVAGQISSSTPKLPSVRSLRDEKDEIKNGYMKTTSMAKFYYRRSNKSDPNMTSNLSDTALSDDPDLEASSRYERRKSKSTMDLASKLKNVNGSTH